MLKDQENNERSASEDADDIPPEDQSHDEDTPIEDDSQEEALPFRYSITSYGADYPIDGLVKRLSKKDVFIPAFQRSYIWPLPKASRFIESLLLGLPVPGIFLSRETESGKLLVIDGQQRLRTLQYFYDGVFAPSGREFKLAGLASRFEGTTYRTLAEDDRRRLDDCILHATIVRQEEPSEDDSSVYHIFERLNTGGVQLLPQEIRACVYHGEFNHLLGALNKDEAWRAIYGKASKRMRDQELILRFLALYFDSPNYARPMKEFLNTYMARNKHFRHESKAGLKSAFESTIRIIHRGIGQRAFRPVRALNAAVFDAVMVGVAHREKEGVIGDLAALRAHYEALLEKDEFKAATETATTSEANVHNRIQLAREAFAGI